MLLLLPFVIYSQESEQAKPKVLGPSDTVREFYRLLREKQYREGFALSVYASAIEGLSEEELAELVPDFEQTFSEIPKEIKLYGEQTSGNVATVFMKSSDDPADMRVEEVTLLKVDGRWRVGDEQTYEMVKAAGNRFFFEAKMYVNEQNVERQVGKLIGAQKLYVDSRGRYANIDELIEANFWFASQRSLEISGYKIGMELSEDKKSYWIHAEPLVYGRTGKHSFYADVNGIHRVDNGGKVFRKSK
ncbi:MAG: hypothetical protein RMM17_05920 [Acidobacteriota bacterium]|nr:hypothetical protein [Blastocatellia bacterium]MDW8412204.1 hypothetical protein [Acidobacteriota bacterium]